MLIIVLLLLLLLVFLLDELGALFLLLRSIDWVVTRGCVFGYFHLRLGGAGLNWCIPFFTIIVVVVG
jgi:hypothetical protein